MSALNLNYAKLKDSYLFANIAAKVRAYEVSHPDQRLLRLGIGDVTQPLSAHVIRALAEGVKDQSAKETFHGYMPECGDVQLRLAIAQYYAEHNVFLKDEEVFVSAGASDELGDILHLFDRNLPALIIEPAYPAYADANIMDGREVIYLKAEAEEGFVPLPPAEERQMLIYLCSPNNPTGAVYSRDVLEKWVDYAQRTDSVIIFDAAYESFISEPDIPHSIFEIPDAKMCAIEICSLSKTAGFTGTRCGYTLISEKLIRDGYSLRDMWVRNRTTRTNGVSYIIQKGALAVFSEEGQQEVKELLWLYRTNAEVFMKALDEAGLTYTGGRNAPYIWMRTPQPFTSWEMFDLLLEKAQIIATPGVGFGQSGEGWIRFSMFADKNDVAEAGRRMIRLRGEKYF